MVVGIATAATAVIVGAVGYVTIVGHQARQQGVERSPVQGALDAGEPERADRAVGALAARHANVAPLNELKNGVTERRRGVPDLPGAVQDKLRRGELRDAQALVAQALTNDRGNQEALQLRDEVRQQEQRRDAALVGARACQDDALWQCVRHRASDALAMDATSADARDLLEAAIRMSGWNGQSDVAGIAPSTTPSTAPSPAPMPTPAPTTTLTLTPSTTPAPTAIPAAVASVDAADQVEKRVLESGWAHPASDIVHPASAIPATAAPSAADAARVVPPLPTQSKLP